MRRKIELYIGTERADLEEQGLVLMNYAFTDVQNPAVVRNSWSCEVSLPGTPANDAIFSHYSRPDHAAGEGFSALRKTDFIILADDGRVLEKGYLRLDSVTRKGDVILGWKVSLFGGLGGFFYGLSTNADGSKRTLADLDYLQVGGERELDFPINAQSVLDAWDHLDDIDEHDRPEEIWDVVNFAPAYEGLPEGNYSADKGLITAATCGQPSEVEDKDGNLYYPYQNSGKLLVNMAGGRDGWACKDLRSYLQRPVFRMSALLAALANRDNNGGYDFDFSAVPAECYTALWKTLPLIPSLNAGTIRGTEAVTLSSSAGSGPVVATWTMGAELDTAHRIKATFMPRLVADFGARNETALYGISRIAASQYGVSVLFLQIVAEDGQGNAIGGSPVRCISGLGSTFTPEEVATAFSFTPAYPAEYEQTAIGNQVLLTRNIGETEFRLFPALVRPLSVETNGGYRWRLYIHAFQGTYNAATNSLSLFGGGTDAKVRGYVSQTAVLPRIADAVRVTDSTASVPYETTAEGRTGATITKRMLLASDHTPADYLIGWAKVFGLVFLYDGPTRKVRVVSRDDFFVDETIDLSQRVDRSREVSITPLNCGYRWYLLEGEVAEGAWVKQYGQLYGVPYGYQRINTGYEFNADSRNILEGVPFRGAATILSHNKYWNIITQAGTFRPSVFLDPGTTCSYWEANGNEYQNPVSILSTASIAYYNEYNHPNYDVEFSPKLDLRDAEGKGVDGEDILVWYTAKDTYDDFKVSDDTPLMLAINGGVPCWDLDPGAGVSVPCFQRYNDYFETWRVTRSLDYGTPRELDIPYLILPEEACAYAKGWRAWLADRLDQDTKVMRCRVSLHGLQAGPELLRRFFWYEGALWVLNKISNYSLTTWDPAECEFIQVRDKDNYINGQYWQ